MQMRMCAEMSMIIAHTLPLSSLSRFVGGYGGQQNGYGGAPPAPGAGAGGDAAAFYSAYAAQYASVSLTR
jgi:hypothetical protein